MKSYITHPIQSSQVNTACRTHANPRSGARTVSATRGCAFGLVLLALATSLRAVASPAGFQTSVAPYAVSLTADYQIVPLISAGDRVPLSGNAQGLFQLVGVPDGLGLAPSGHHQAVLYVNHEFGGTALSEPVIGAPLYKGAFISSFRVDHHGGVLSGNLAYDAIVDPAGQLLPPARQDNTTPPLWRLCSGTLAWREAGFDRPIYLCGEESPSPNTFDGKGGLALALIDRTLYTLPQLGHFQHENVPVRPDRGNQTVLLLLEDNAGPNAAPYQAQLYMFVGQKDRSRNASALARNGLAAGRFYVFVSAVAGVNNEAQFQTGTIQGNWVEISGVSSMNEAQLEAASQAVGAFGFVKTEDGVWSPRNANEFFFNSTGDTLNSSTVGNHLGRTYRLELDGKSVTGPASLSVIYNADERIRNGEDIALTPDNIGASRDYLMVCEDGTGYSRTVMAGLGRDGQIWRYDLRNNYAAVPVVELAPPGRDGVAVAPGVWETSGIVDTSSFFGRGSWLFDIQAHPPTTAPAPNTVEDGQVLLLLPVGDDCHEEDDDEGGHDRD